MDIRRGDIVIVALEAQGSRQGGLRPAIVYSNDKNNMFAPTVNVVPVTSGTKVLYTHFIIEGCGLHKPSTVLPEQITTVDREQITKKIGTLSKYYMQRLDESMDIQFGRVESKYIDPLGRTA